MSERVSDVAAADSDTTVALPSPRQYGARQAFAAYLDRRALAIDPAALGGLNPLLAAANALLAVAPQIRQALRHPDPEDLRAKLRQEIEAFERGARSSGVAEEQVLVARHALCAYLDDCASATPWGARWGRKGLVADLEGPAGGDKFFSLLDRMLTQPAAYVGLLEFFYVCLALGYEGRYRGGEGGRLALTEFRRRLHQVLGAQRASGDVALSASLAAARSSKPRLDLDSLLRFLSGRRRRLPRCVLLGAPASGKASLAGCWGSEHAIVTQATASETGLLDRLEGNRAQGPLIAVVATLSAADLLHWSDEEVAAYAAQLRERIMELKTRHGDGLPVHVLVTKTDLLAGFAEFFAGFDAAARGQLWGVAFERTSRPQDIPSLVTGFEAALGDVERRLYAMLLDRLQEERDLQRRGAIYRFPLQFHAFRPLLAQFMAAFGSGWSAGRPFVRGIHFASVAQEGSPVDRVLDTLARRLNLERKAPPPAIGAGKVFFARQLLRHLIVADAR